jgi:hypothetical protein
VHSFSSDFVFWQIASGNVFRLTSFGYLPFEQFPGGAFGRREFGPIENHDQLFIKLFKIFTPGFFKSNFADNSITKIVGYNNTTFDDRNRTAVVLY